MGTLENPTANLGTGENQGQSRDNQSEEEPTDEERAAAECANRAPTHGLLSAARKHPLRRWAPTTVQAPQLDEIDELLKKRFPGEAQLDGQAQAGQDLVQKIKVH